jgi:hypothetical protein
MAISPLSDIVLEVAKAADPAKSSAAAARLGAGASAYAGSFEEALGATRSPAFAPRTPFDPALAVVQMQSSDALKRPAATYERFEAFVLQTFIQSMLPQKGEGLYGAGTAGEIWKSMLAESLGAQLAQVGGIGIARMLAADAARNEGEGSGPVGPTRS